MKPIVVYVTGYARWLNKPLLLLTIAALSVLIFFNYRYEVATTINDYPFLYKFLLYDLLFLFVFAGCWFGSLDFGDNRNAGKSMAPRSIRFYVLMAIAPAIFAIKVALPVQAAVGKMTMPAGLNYFLQVVAQWPVKAVFVFISVRWLWKYFDNLRPFAGMPRFTKAGLLPYFMLLLFMLPLLVLAGLLPDFQSAYPKLQLLGSIEDGEVPLWKAIIFEGCYGLDFFTIEFFFRGFLILAFAKFAGKAAILPMAAFYCTIHFGKPIGECVSSFFGGIILGAVVYNTRSIWGGLIVHLGVAWAMEIVGLML